jgi:hypothetical protein
MVKSVAKKESVAGQFAVKYKTEMLSWTNKISKEDSGIDKYLVLLPDKVVVDKK